MASTTKMASLSHFLNLDLVLKSNSDLSPIIKHFDQKVIVLAHENFERQFLLNLELANSDSTKEPGWCTRGFLTLIEALPEAERALWNGCISRTFSYGFESGREFPALDTTITSDLLLRIAKLGADIGITIYPYQPD
jgi:hypothetical protein